jgi:hypothetical protein
MKRADICPGKRTLPNLVSRVLMMCIFALTGHHHILSVVLFAGTIFRLVLVS